MKKLFSTSAAVIALALGGCSSTSTVTPTSLNTTITTIAADVIGFARTICGFQPTIATAEAIITSLYPGASVATVPEQAIAQTICNSIPPPAVAAARRLGAGAAIVYPGTNIVIHGTYVGRSLGAHHRGHA